MLNKRQKNVYKLLFIIASLGSIGLSMVLLMLSCPWVGGDCRSLGETLFYTAIISLVPITLNYFAYLGFMKSEPIFDIIFWVWIVPQILVALLIFGGLIGSQILALYILIILFFLRWIMNVFF